MTFGFLWQFLAVRIALLSAGALFIGYCLSLDWFARLAWFFVRAVLKSLRRAIWLARHTRRVKKRVPLRSTKRDAKRAAHAYCEKVAGRPLTWKAARKMMKRFEREGRALKGVA